MVVLGRPFNFHSKTAPFDGRGRCFTIKTMSDNLTKKELEQLLGEQTNTILSAVDGQILDFKSNVNGQISDFKSDVDERFEKLEDMVLDFKSDVDSRLEELDKRFS